MGASQPRTSTGELRAAPSTRRGADGERHRVATETVTHAECPARSPTEVVGRGVDGTGDVVVEPPLVWGVDMLVRLAVGAVAVVEGAVVEGR